MLFPLPPAPVRWTNSKNFFDLSEDEILDPSTDELGAGILTKFIKSQRKCDATTHDSDRPTLCTVVSIIRFCNLLILPFN